MARKEPVTDLAEGAVCRHTACGLQAQLYLGDCRFHYPIYAAEAERKRIHLTRVFSIDMLSHMDLSNLHLW